MEDAEIRATLDRSVSEASRLSDRLYLIASRATLLRLADMRYARPWVVTMILADDRAGERVLVGPTFSLPLDSATLG